MQFKRFFNITSRMSLFVGLCLALGSCQKNAQEVVVYTSVDQIFSEPIFNTFEKKTGITVKAVFDTEETKSTGVLNRLIAESKKPQADVFWSGDPVRPFLLIKRGLVESFVAPNARSIPANFKAENATWTGFAARARILLINTQRISGKDKPTSVKDLANPRWKGQTAIANPLFGTTTMHIAALFTLWGDKQTRQFLNDLKTNQVRLASSNGEVKRLVVSGEVAFGLTDTDDAHEAIQSDAPVEVVYPDQASIGTLMMPTTAVLIKGGPNPETARKLIDFLVSAEVEQHMSKSAAHIPVRPELVNALTLKKNQSLVTMKVNYAQLGDQMERIQPWLREWVGL